MTQMCHHSQALKQFTHTLIEVSSRVGVPEEIFDRQQFKLQSCSYMKIIQTSELMRYVRQIRNYYCLAVYVRVTIIK